MNIQYWFYMSCNDDNCLQKTLDFEYVKGKTATDEMKLVF